MLFFVHSDAIVIAERLVVKQDVTPHLVWRNPSFVHFEITVACPFFDSAPTRPTVVNHVCFLQKWFYFSLNSMKHDATKSFDSFMAPIDVDVILFLLLLGSLLFLIGCGSPILPWLCLLGACLLLDRVLRPHEYNNNNNIDTIGFRRQ